MKTIGVAIIAFNEAENIERVLKSVSFADDIVLVDSGSSDGTPEIAARNRARVFHKKWNGYSEQKQFALDQLKTDWVIPLDADEWLTDDSRNEIKATVNLDSTFDAYRLNGRNLFMGRALTTGKGLDNSIRLFKRAKGKYDGRVIHESLIVDGTMGQLKTFLIHNSTPTISERLGKIVMQSDLEMHYWRPGETSLFKLLSHPIRYFFSYYLRHKTWRDGVPGLVLLALLSFQIFILHAKYFEKDILNKTKV